MNARDKLLRALARRINPHRRFDVEHVRGDIVRFTCKTCGKTTEEPICGRRAKPHVARARMPEQLAKKMVRYWQNTGGITDHCTYCTVLARAEYVESLGGIHGRGMQS